MKSKYKILIFGTPTNSSYKSLKINGFINGGGWLESFITSKFLKDNFSVFFCSFYKIKNCVSNNENGITYVGIPEYNFNSCNLSLNKKNEIRKIVDNIKPDLIHIFGSDRPHAEFLIKEFKNINMLVSVTGLISEISKVYYNGLGTKDIFKNLTIGDVLRRKTIFNQKKYFTKKGKIELNILANCENIAGRTQWDKMIIQSNNPNCNYFFLRETLRQKFYENKNSWNYSKCQKKVFFMSEASYPIKGLHYVIKAISLLKTKYPDITLKIGGPNIIKHNSFSSYIRFTNYGKLIWKLIKHNSLQNNILFLGPLNDAEMIQEYKTSHGVIMASNIENSSNTVAEAMMIGTPVISTLNCGLKSLCNEGKNCLTFKNNDPVDLAKKIDEFIKKEETVVDYSKRASEFISNYFSFEEMEKDIENIYKRIIKKE